MESSERVASIKRVNRFPERYVLRRCREDVHRRHSRIFFNEGYPQMTNEFEKIKDVEKAFNETVGLAIVTPERLVRLRQAIESTRDELLNWNALDCTDNSGPRVTISWDTRRPAPAVNTNSEGQEDRIMNSSRNSRRTRRGGEQNMLCNSGAPRTKSRSPKRGHQSQVLVNTSQTPYKRSITNNRTPISLVKTGYRLLGHLPGLSWGQPQFRAPPDSPLGDYPTAEHDAMSMVEEEVDFNLRILASVLNQGLKFGENQVNGCVSGLHLESQEGLETEVGPKADLRLAGINYEMPELGYDGLVLGIWTLSVEPHYCIRCFKFGA
ncbi:hypothetical protein M9H77_30377 [Catharanthus roseus]|uniref:Uncharacterized protein n=1 Tax=Catharanthus roseus TaxID=4058 RepID=A0ACB9ZY49_CATRO|nr:hypothetical protein M9H77_30377 [Catharanthus roseus]